MMMKLFTITKNSDEDTPAPGTGHQHDAAEHKKEEQEEANHTFDAADVILKIPALTWYYWCEKMTATTFGETFADFWSQTLGFGYGATSGILMSLFVLCLSGQLYVKSYVPVLFWAVMSTSSIAGTLFSDFIDRTLEWGYPKGMGVLLGILFGIFLIWKLTGMHMNVAGAMDRRQEALYWSAILISNTLGTALGDFLADSLELGFAVTAGTIGGVLVILAGLAYVTTISHVVLFWIAFVLTRPFGAAFGDLLTKSKEKGGLDLGTLNASMVILALFLIFFGYEMYVLRKDRKAKEAADARKKLQKKETLEITDRDVVVVDDDDIENGNKKGVPSSNLSFDEEA